MHHFLTLCMGPESIGSAIPKTCESPGLIDIIGHSQAEINRLGNFGVPISTSFAAITDGANVMKSTIAKLMNLQGQLCMTHGRHNAMKKILQLASISSGPLCIDDVANRDEDSEADDKASDTEEQNSLDTTLSSDNWDRFEEDGTPLTPVRETLGHLRKTLKNTTRSQPKRDRLYVLTSSSDCNDKPLRVVLHIKIR